MAKITVQNTDISVVCQPLAKIAIFRWLSLKSTIEYLGEWEMLYNPDFNCTEFGTIKNAAGSNNFVLSVKTWIEVPVPSAFVLRLVATVAHTHIGI